MLHSCCEGARALRDIWVDVADAVVAARASIPRYSHVNLRARSCLLVAIASRALQMSWLIGQWQRRMTAVSPLRPAGAAFQHGAQAAGRAHAPLALRVASAIVFAGRARAGSLQHRPVVLGVAADALARRRKEPHWG